MRNAVAFNNCQETLYDNLAVSILFPQSPHVDSVEKGDGDLHEYLPHDLILNSILQ